MINSCQEEEKLELLYVTYDFYCKKNNVTKKDGEITSE